MSQDRRPEIMNELPLSPACVHIWWDDVMSGVCVCPIKSQDQVCTGISVSLQTTKTMAPLPWWWPCWPPQCRRSSECPRCCWCTWSWGPAHRSTSSSPAQHSKQTITSNFPHHGGLKQHAMSPLANKLKDIHLYSHSKLKMGPKKADERAPNAVRSLWRWKNQHTRRRWRTGSANDSPSLGSPRVSKMNKLSLWEWKFRASSA